MASKLWALLLTSLLSLPASAQRFGRFGYVESASLGGFTLNKSGILPKAPLATNLEFDAPGTVWNPVETSEFGQTVLLSDAPNCPAEAEFSLLKPGVKLQFPRGFKLKFRTKVRGFLTWHEGSVADGVPTPASPWLILSFEDDVPPYLIQFEPGKQQSVTLKEREGIFTLETEKPYSGWVRISLPRGGEGIATNSAASLGRLVVGMERNLDFWLSEPPELLDRHIDSDAQGLTVTWTFSRPYAVVPCAFYLANLGGYPCRVLSGVKKVGVSDEMGPLVVCSSSELKVRLPVRRVPTGRFLSSAINPPPQATASYLDVPTIVNLAFETMPSGRDVAVKNLAETTVADFLSESAFVPEPHTGVDLPYAADGKGLDLAAAHALLAQAVTSTQEATSQANSLLSSISWRRDWATQGYPDIDPVVARRACALGAVAGALCPEPDRRLEGALFQAGLSAERGLHILQRRSGNTHVDPLIEPIEGVRQVLFGMTDKVQAADAPLAKALLNEVRVYGDPSVLVDPKEKGLVVSWSGRQFVTFGAPFNLILQDQERFDTFEGLGFKRVRPKVDGFACRLSLPPYAKNHVSLPEIPTYSEPSH